MTEVVFDPDARTEFLEAVEYYEGCRRGLGRRFRNAVETQLQHISRTPLQYRVLHAPFRRCLIPNFP